MSLINKYFDFTEKLFISELTFSIATICELDPQNRYLNGILYLHKINKHIFIEELAKNLKKENLDNVIKRSPSAIQDKQYLWLYYSFYHSFKLYKNKPNESKFIKQTIDLVLSYHYNYLIALNKYPVSSEENVTYKLNYLAQSIVRALEILTTFYFSEYRDKLDIYFVEYGNLFLNFVDIIANKNEIEKYSVTKPEKTNSTLNIIKYKYVEIVIEINTTRRLVKDDKILDYIIEQEKIYRDFLLGEIDLSRQKELVERNRIKATGLPDSDEITQVLIHDRMPQVLSINRAESIEQQSKEFLTARTDKNASLFKQRLINKAYSANVTKDNLCSVKSYDIPPVGLLKEFLTSLFGNKNISTKNSIFNLVFFFGIVSSQSYMRTVKILKEEYEEIKFDFNKMEMFTKINEGLFANKINIHFFQKNNKTVYYKIPYFLSMALNQCSKTISNSSNNFLSEEIEKEYYAYINKQITGFHKTIKINVKRIGRIAVAYLREKGLEDISIMFCSAIYSKNQTAKMAYTSIHKHVRYYSGYLKELYDELNGDLLLSHYLNIKYQESIKKDKILQKREYAGSNLLVDDLLLKNFFSKLHDLIEHEDKLYLRFNYITIYVRFALSLLAGTRTFHDSASLENISFEHKIMKISEKAETQLSGLRLVPLCESALELIHYYKDQLSKFELDKNNFYIYKEGSFHKFKIEKNLFENIHPDVVEFISNVPLNFGRHLFTKFAIEQKLSRDHLDAFLGHYSSGLEQFGIYSSLNFPHYINEITQLTEMLADIYGVETL